MIQLETTLTQLNDLFEALGTWQEVARRIQFNRATINKWFAGTRVPCQQTREYIAIDHHAIVRRRQA